MSFESSLLEFRFTEKSGPELIEFNVWGYFGAVVLQSKGVILITSTAAADDAGQMAPPAEGEAARDAGRGNGGAEPKSGRGK